LQALLVVANINTKAFIGSVKDAFGKPPDNIDPTSVFRELGGWDSLTSVMLVAEIYAKFQVHISGDEMSGCRTVADLMSLVEAKLASGPR
jgi:acyl carrier protein